MYEVRIDGRILYYPNDEEYELSEAVIEKSIADAGSFSFTIPSANPERNNLKTRASEITVLEDGKEIFSGELRTVEEDYFKNKKCYAIGELAYLSDTIQPQDVFHDYTPIQLLTTFINRHNALCGARKQFTVGAVNVIDKNNSIYRYSNRENTYQAITEKLTGKLGGYLKIRKENEIRYLDWLTAETYGKVCNQPIRFEENLLDYSSSLSGEDIATACVPLGGHLDESEIEGLDAYVDITSVNGGKEYISIPDAVNNFGWVEAVVNFDDVTEPANLLAKGMEWLTNNQYEKLVLNLTAIDLRKLGFEYDEIEVGDYVHVTAKPYGLDKLIQVTQRSIDLLDPSKNTFQLGREEDISMTAIQAKQYQQHEEKIQEKSEQVWGKIENATAMITGAKGGYKLSEFDSNGKWIRDLYMDMPTKEAASRVMQINMNGIGFSRNGYSGPYENAWTIDGNLVADFITSGTMYADRIKGGTLELGGKSNQNGILKILNASGQQIGVWDKDGIGLESGPSKVNFTSQQSGSAIELIGNVIYGTGRPDKSRTTIDSLRIKMYSDRDDANRSYVEQDAEGITFWIDRNEASFYGPDNMHTVDAMFDGNLDVIGEKNRIVKTPYGRIKLSAYEMASPMFGDTGSGEIGDDGLCYVALDSVFLETVNAGCEYQVFLQTYGPGNIYVSERTPAFFVAAGVPGQRFGWELKAKQKEYEQNRLDCRRERFKAQEAIDYAGDGLDYYKNYMEGLLCEKSQQ